jgi:hypothetical protein
VLSGEGASYVMGSRASLGLVVRVTGADRKPVPGAVVTFRLPSSGPGGSFANGLSEIVTTTADGKAEAWSLKVNETPGTFEIRVTAVKEGARGEAVIAQSIMALGSGAGKGSGGSLKWLALVAAAAVGGVVAALAGGSGGSTGAPGSGGSQNPSSPPTPGAQIGIPTVTIRNP